MKTNETTPIPQGYKATPLGIIPQEWEVRPISKAFRIQSGYAFKSELFTKEGGNPVVRISNLPMNDKYIDLSDCVYYPASINVKEQFIVHKNDFLIAMSGATTGKSAIYNYDYEALLNQRVGVFRQISDKIDSQYLHIIMRSQLFIFQLQYLLIAGAQPNVSPNDIENMVFPIPPLAEQKKIAEVLGVWDKAIEKQSQLIEQLTLRKRGLMQQLLAGKKRIPGFSGEWRKEKAGSIFENSSVRSNKSEPLLSATQEYGVVPRDMLETRVTMPSGNLSSFKRVDIGDFVISLRSFEGGIEYSKYSGIVSPAYTVLKKKHNVNDIFYKAYFKSHEFIQRLAIAVIGIRDGKQISYSDFCYIRIPLPSFEEQTAIAEVLTAADREIELAQQKLELLRQQKRGLMQQLLTGKKRVKL